MNWTNCYGTDTLYILKRINSFKPVSQSTKVENTPDAGTDLFFLGSQVKESLMYSPLDVITGQFGLGLYAQLKDLQQNIDLKFPTLQCL